VCVREPGEGGLALIGCDLWIIRVIGVIRRGGGDDGKAGLALFGGYLMMGGGGGGAFGLARVTGYYGY